jgi:hypothetical protein
MTAEATKARPSPSLVRKAFVSQSPFPSRRLVVLALVINIALGAVMVFGTLARVTEFADGLEPFDLRPRGYSIGEARTLIVLMGEEGRRYYATVHQWVANLYPMTFLFSRGLLIWWLTAPGRVTPGRLHPAMRFALLLIPVVELVPDYLENVRILEMLSTGGALDSDLVASASADTQTKILLTALTELTCVVLAAMALFRWASSRRRAGA